jgi:hypothetical protein
MQRLIFSGLAAVTGAQQVLQARAETAQLQAAVAAFEPQVKGAKLRRSGVDLLRNLSPGVVGGLQPCGVSSTASGLNGQVGAVHERPGEPAEEYHG